MKSNSCLLPRLPYTYAVDLDLLPHFFCIRKISPPYPLPLTRLLTDSPALNKKMPLIHISGHYLDQKRLKQGLYRHPWDDISYVLPEHMTM